MSKVNPVSRIEFAKMRGVSAVAVHKAIKAGRISTLADGTIDPVVANIQWEANTRARVVGSKAEPAPEPDLLALATQPSGSTAALAPSTPPAPAPDTGYNAARARREVAEAEQAEIDLRKAKGELVAWQDVARGGFEVGRDVRDTMESAVNALAAELAAEANAERCAEILRRHNRTVCDVLVKSWREKLGPAPEGLQA